MGMVSELIVSVGVEGTQAVVDALKKVDGAQVELKDSASTSADDMGKSWGGLTEDLDLSLLAIGATVATVGGVIANFIKDAADDWSDYNIEMEKGATATGLMVDEYSRIVQAADDAFVSQDKMSKALESATKNGYPMTIESLGQIADKLNAIKDPAEKAKEATEIFGQGWVDILPFLEQGSDGINNATQAIKDNLIATEDSVEKSKAYKGAVDDLTDAWTGFRNTVGGAVIPVLTDSMNIITEQISQTEMWTNNTRILEDAYKSGKISWIEYNTAMLKNTWDAADGTKAIEKLGLAQEKTNAVMDEGATMASMYAQSAAIMEAFTEKNAEAQTELDKAAAEVTRMIYEQIDSVTSLDSNFGSIIGLAKQFTTSLEEITKQEQIMADTKGIDPEKFKAAEQAVKDLKQGMTDLANQMTLDMFQATIAIGGVTDAEMGAYLDMAVDMGFISQEGAGAAIDAYNDAIGKINGLTIDEKTGNVVVDAAAAYAAFDAIEAYAFAEKTVRVMMKMGGGSDIGMQSAGPWDQAIGGPVYPGNVYNWQEPGREGEILLPSQYGRVMSSTEVAQMLREATRPGDGVSTGNQAQETHIHNTEVVINANVASDYDLDKLTREIVRRINA